jgi:hypothetical protein
MHIHLPRHILSGFVLALIVGVIATVAILFIPSLAPAEPKITWIPSQISETVSPKQSKSVTVSFTSSENISNIAVRVVPEIQPFLHVEPSAFSSFKPGGAVTVTLIIAPSADAPLGTFDGTIQLKSTGKSSKTFAKPLPITLNIWQSVAEKGLVLAYPPLWQRNPIFTEPNHPISLDTFNSKYGQGGVIPKGAAVITILKLSSSINEIISKDSVETTIRSTDTTLVDGTEATKIIYAIPFEPLFTYSNVIVYVPKGTTVYKFSLLYREGDPNEEEFLSNFQQILDTVQFMQ